MKKVNIIKNGNITNSGYFSSQELAEQWILNNNQAFPIEFEQEILDVTSEFEQRQTNNEALAYLVSTDWLIIREMDEGTICPIEIKEERAAARLRIVR